MDVFSAEREDNAGTGQHRRRSHCCSRLGGHHFNHILHLRTPTKERTTSQVRSIRSLPLKSVQRLKVFLRFESNSLEKVTADKIQFRNHSSCHSFGATPLKTYPLFYHHHQPIRVDNKTPPTLGLGVVDALRVATVERKHNEPISLLVRLNTTNCFYWIEMINFLLSIQQTLALSMNVVAEGCPVPKRDQTVVVLSNDFVNKTMIDQPSS